MLGSEPRRRENRTPLVWLPAVRFSKQRIFARERASHFLLSGADLSKRFFARSG